MATVTIIFTTILVVAFAAARFSQGQYFIDDADSIQNAKRALEPAFVGTAVDDPELEDFHQIMQRRASMYNMPAEWMRIISQRRTSSRRQPEAVRQPEHPKKKYLTLQALQRLLYGRMLG